MKFIKKLIARVTVDELGEPNILIKFIGITFIIFGIMFTFDLILITPQFLMCIAIAGVLFVFSDISQYYYDNYTRRVDLTDTHRYWAKSTWKISKFISLFFTIFSLIAGPYIILPFSDSTVEKSATIITVIAIGLTIFNVSLNNTKKRLELYESIATDFEELYKEYEKIKKTHEDSIQIQNELNKTFKSFTSDENEYTKHFKQTNGDPHLLMKEYSKLPKEHEPHHK